MKRALPLPDVTLTPLIATLVFVFGCVCGMQYRRVWRAEGPTWQLWIFGVGAAAALLLVGFVPMQPT